MSTHLLQNHRVLLLRSELGLEAKRLKTLGAEVVHCPLLELNKNSEVWSSPPRRRGSRFRRELDSRLRGNDGGNRRLAQFDWIVFTSVTGVKYFHERFFRLPKNLNIASIGPQTDRAVRKFFKRRSRFIPPAYTTESLAKNLTLTPASSILLIRSKIADYRMDKILKSRGARVKRWSIYDAKPKKPSASVARSLLGGKITDIFFGSASQVKTFVMNFTAKEVRQIFSDRMAQAFAIGPETAKALKASGISARAAKEHTFDGLIELLCATVKTKNFS